MFCCILCTEKLFYAKMITKLLFPPLFRPMEHQADGGSVKEITKLEKTSLSDFTLCEAELLPKLLKQLEESLTRFFPDLHQFINRLCCQWRHVWKY